MVRHSKLQNQPPQKDLPQTRRTIQNRRKTRTNNISTKTSQTWKIHNVFQATLLHLYIENKIYGNNYPRLPAELVEGEEVYKVDSILKHQRRGRGYQYYIKWKEYPITEATWENKLAFSKDSDTLAQYKLWNQLWITIDNNMPSMQLSWSTPNLQTKTSRIWLDDKEVKQTISSLEEELEGMFTEYKHMDKPIKSWQQNILELYQKLWIFLTPTCLLSPPSPMSKPNLLKFSLKLNYHLFWLPLPPTLSLL